jgi:two-component system, OmpR family, response regulator
MTTVLHAPTRSDDLDFTGGFEGAARAELPLEARSEDEQQQVILGADALHRAGYYVNIARKAKRVAPLPLGSKYSVLCIDDDEVLLGILAKKLQLDGYIVRTASDRPAIMVELNRPVLPHLILLDVGMPGFSGFDLLVKLRKHPKLGAIPVIMLTAHASPQHVLHGMVGGADGYVSKPFQFEALTAAIETVLGIQH